MISKYKLCQVSDCSISSEVEDYLNVLTKNHQLNILLYGTPGTGKTSLINLLVQNYYKDCENIRENLLNINSLQEQGIQYYRNEVKNFCQTKSSIPGYKKTIVIDNIDEIGEQQQQIFQNYIDKFDIQFIASASNLIKVNHNIISRLQYIKVGDITRQNLSSLYDKVHQGESLSHQLNTNSNKELIIELSGQSYKKLLNNILKIKLYGHICTNDHILKLCSNIDIQYYDTYIEQICEKNFTESLNVLYAAYNNEGYSIQDIFFYFYFYIKSNKNVADQFKYEMIKIITKYIAIIINNCEDELELALFTYECINL